MNDQELINKQKEWIDLLISFNKDRPLYGQYVDGRPDDFKKPWVILDRNDIILTRQILSREIVFDFDFDTWEKVRNNARKLKEYLDYFKIPYIMACSGGKGIHIHVFIDEKTLNLKNEDLIIQRSIDLDIDIAKVLRKTIFDDIVKKVKIQVASPKNRSGLDTSKVYFSLQTGKGSMIRDFGCYRLDGKAKSVINDIPNDVPSIKKENVEFPKEIKLANISRWSEMIEKALEKTIMGEVLKDEEGEIEINCKGNEIPCYNNLLKGVDKGARNLAVFSLGRLGSMVGNTEKETIEDMETFCKNSNYKMSEAIQTVKSAYKGKDRHRFCGTIKTAFGEKVCDKNNCPIIKHLNSKKV